jgi:hypothetical protein
MPIYEFTQSHIAKLEETTFSGRIFTRRGSENSESTISQCLTIPPKYSSLKTLKTNCHARESGHPANLLNPDSGFPLTRE